MRTDFSAELLATDAGQRANDILRACVHCGFCNATCPTYQITGDELDGPRGRIYLMRELLENDSNRERATFHLDRCLTCRACETTCPSGVAYGELAEIAREHIGDSRSGWLGKVRSGLRWIVPHAGRLRRMSRLGKLFKWFVPARLAGHLPAVIGKPLELTTNKARKVFMLNGCAQQVSTPNTNRHLATLLENHNIGVVTSKSEQCCGALDLHLGAGAASLDYMRRNVDFMYPLLEEVEGIVSTASGCGVTYKDYGRLLAGDEEYAQKAKAVSAAVLDVSEYITGLGLSLRAAREERRVAWHTPCTLQHGQQLGTEVASLLTAAGYDLVPVEEAHLCCGSAGSYAILEPQMSHVLRARKLNALTKGRPEIIATANVGCQTHLQTGVKEGDEPLDVVHWIELLM